MKHWLILFSVLALAACDKDDDGPPGGVTFDIDTPAESVTYQYGQVVNIRATIAGRDTMHGYRGWVVNKVNGDTLLRFVEHEHGKSLSVNKGFTNEVTANAAAELILQADLDHDGNYVRSGPRRFDLLKR